MLIEHHDLHHEFPEYSKEIRQLKMGNPHFARIFDEYHQMTKQIEQVESNDSPLADTTLETMKKTRLRLKDELYRMLQAA